MESSAATSPFESLDPQRASEKLRSESVKISEIPDITERKRQVIEVVSQMDTQALLQILEEIGVDKDLYSEETIRLLLQESANDALKFFHEDMSAEKSAAARNKAGSLLSLRLGMFFHDFFTGSGLYESVNAWKEPYAEMLVHTFQGDSQKFKKLAQTNGKNVLFFLLATFSAHTRWAAGQVERSRNEKPVEGWGKNANPLERPIYTDLRNVVAAKAEEYAIAGKGSASPEQSIKLAIDSILQDWEQVSSDFGIQRSAPSRN